MLSLKLVYVVGSRHISVQTGHLPVRPSHVEPGTSVLSSAGLIPLSKEVVGEESETNKARF